MIKLIALDIDGTILHRRKIHRKTINSILEAKKQKINICLASGRGPLTMKKIAKKLGLWDDKSLMVGFNGAIVYKFKHNGDIQELSHKNINEKEAWEIYEEALKRKIRIFGYSHTDKVGVVKNKHGLFEKFMKYRTKYKLKQVSKKENMPPIVKFVIFGEKDKMNIFRQELEAQDLSVFAWSYSDKQNANIEVNAPNIDKSVGLEKVIANYRIKKEEVAFFGDGENDIAAIKWAGLGVAMGNANDHVKSFANYVTTEVQDLGVSKGIQKIINKEIE